MRFSQMIIVAAFVACFMAAPAQASEWTGDYTTWQTSDYEHISEEYVEYSEVVICDLDTPDCK